MSLGSEPRSAAIDAQTVQAMITAIDRAQAIIEFDLQGNILAANANFLATVGYELDQVWVGTTACSANPTTCAPRSIGVLAQAPLRRF